MKRVKIKLALLLIAVGSAVYWAQPPYLLGGPMLMVWSVLWSLVAAAALRFSKAEDWSYRLGSFLGMALATIEATAGMIGIGTREGLLAMALLHGAAFGLSLAGRFQKVSAGRQRLL